MNPGKNDKFIIREYRKRLRKRLLNKVLQSPTHVSVVKKVKVRRVNNRLVYTLSLVRVWKASNKGKQLFKRVKKNANVTLRCFLHFDKKLKSNCKLVQEKLHFSIKNKTGKRMLYNVCRYSHSDKLKVDSKIVYLDCLNGDIHSESKISKQNKLKKKGKDSNADGEEMSFNEDESESDAVDKLDDSEDNFYLSEPGLSIATRDSDN